MDSLRKAQETRLLAKKAEVDAQQKGALARAREDHELKVTELDEAIRLAEEQKVRCLEFSIVTCLFFLALSVCGEFLLFSLPSSSFFLFQNKLWARAREVNKKAVKNFLVVKNRMIEAGLSLSCFASSVPF